eukprot:3867508-Prymnesium_polylepis.1
MNEGREANFQARHQRRTGHRRAIRQSGVDADGELHIGDTVPLKDPAEASQGYWGSDGMFQAAADNGGEWKLTSPMGAERATQLEDTLLEWRKKYELKELWLEGLVISIRPGDDDGTQPKV